MLELVTETLFLISALNLFEIKSLICMGKELMHQYYQKRPESQRLELQVARVPKAAFI
jgi:hypothetical protein